MNHGKEVVSDMNTVVAYEIRRNDSEMVKIIIDMTQNFQDKSGFIWVDQPGDNFLKFKEKYAKNPDSIIKMDEATLKRLGDKTISPWFATLIGKLSWSGSLFTAKKMESNVISRYEDIKI